jgi:hypothetical protein
MKLSFPDAFLAQALPDGQISEAGGCVPVQPHLQKYFCFSEVQISLYPFRPVPQRGVGHRYLRGAGCGGREGVGRAMAVAGRDEPRERCAAGKTNGA